MPIRVTLSEEEGTSMSMVLVMCWWEPITKLSVAELYLGLCTCYMGYQQPPMVQHALMGGLNTKGNAIILGLTNQIGIIVRLIVPIYRVLQLCFVFRMLIRMRIFLVVLMVILK